MGRNPELNADGTGYEQLTDGTHATPWAFDSMQPHWSPSGDALAWYDTQGQLMLQIGSWSANARSGADPTDDPYHPISWSPDGQTLYYRNAYNELARIGRDGSGGSIVRDCCIGFPRLSPGGDRILFDNGGLSVIGTDGTGEVSLSPYSGEHATWGPGDTIWDCDEFRSDGIVEIPVDGSPVTVHQLADECVDPVVFSPACFD